MVKLGEVGPDIWEHVTMAMEKKLAHLGWKGGDFQPDWRKLAHKRKLERELYEQYGPWKDVILDARFQLLKHYIQENVDVETFMGEPFIPWSTAIIILLMLNKRVNSNILIFVGVLILNVNPFYITLMTFFLLLQNAFTRKRSKRLKDSVQKKHQIIKKCDVGSSVTEFETLDLNFDHVLVGNDFSTMYTAALLARYGGRCCVLQPKELDISEIHLDDMTEESVPLTHCTLAKPEKYQMLIDIVQNLQTDKRAIFKPVGTELNGFTSSIVAIKTSQKNRKRVDAEPTVAHYAVRAGERSLLEDIAKVLICEDSMLMQLFLKIRFAMENVSTYLLSKVNGFPAAQNVAQTQELFEENISRFLKTNNLAHDGAMDLLGSLCRTCGAREGLSNEKISAASLGNLINTVDSGNFYVDGGAKKLMESLTFTITASSGVILRDINVEHMEFEETDSGLNRLKATCVVFSTSHGTSLCARALKSVVSGVGVLSTYLTLIPRNSISDEMKHKLSCLSEARPKVKIVFLLSGTAEQIGLKTTDYYEILKSQSLPEIDSIFLGSEQYRQLEENIHDSYVHLWSPSAQCVDEASSNIQSIVVEFEICGNMLILENYRGFHESDDGNSFHSGPKLYMSPRDPSTNPNDPHFGEVVGRKLQISAQKQQQLLKRATSILHDVYPRSKDRILSSQVVAPSLGGRKLSDVPEKYAAKLTAKTEIENFYLTGNDIAVGGLMGELQSGWMTTNAILGFTPEELAEGLNVVTELQSLI